MPLNPYENMTGWQATGALKKKKVGLLPKDKWASYSPDWQSIQTATQQKEALTGLTSPLQTQYGMLKGHFDVATKAAMQTQTRQKQISLQERGLKMQEESSKKVICTELHAQGYLPFEILEKDLEHRDKYIDEGTYRGYRMWADTLVEWMKVSKAVTKIVSWFAIPWAYESASRIDPTVKGNIFGKFLIKIGVPICRRIWMHRCIKEMKQGAKI